MTVITSRRLRHHIQEEHAISPLSTYLKEIVYGGTDGIVTTFAVVAGFNGAGAQISGAIPILTVLLFGFANLFADGVSMALGSFLATRSEHDMYKHEEAREQHEIQHNTRQEIEESLILLEARGFTKAQAKQLTEIYATNPKYWVDFMMSEELSLPNPVGENPVKMAGATFVAFILCGLFPLLPYVFLPGVSNVFYISIGSSTLALLLLGYLRHKVTNRSLVRALTESFFLGGTAAAVSYLVGIFFRV